MKEGTLILTGFDQINDFGGSPRRMGPCSLKKFPSVLMFPPGGVLPYMGHLGMCRCEGYGSQAVYSSIGYMTQSVWV